MLVLGWVAIAWHTQAKRLQSFLRLKQLNLRKDCNDGALD